MAQPCAVPPRWVDEQNLSIQVGTIDLRVFDPAGPVAELFGIVSGQLDASFATLPSPYFKTLRECDGVATQAAAEFHHLLQTSAAESTGAPT